MSTQRDELARDIFLADNCSAPKDALLDEWADATPKHFAYRIADGLIAMGYRQVRCTGGAPCRAAIHAQGCFSETA